MQEKDFQELLQKYQSGLLTAAEKAAVEQWYIDNHAVDPGIESIDLEAAQQQSLQALHLQIQPVKTVRLWPRIAAAAAVALMLIAGGYLYFNYSAPTQTADTPTTIKPGKQSATLTLADGSKIVLSDAVNGELAKEAGVSISKTADGQVVYEVKEAQTANSNAINTLTTAKGETYELKLPDGTIVWLNAASTIKYPASLASQSQRRVEISGEAYFKVAQDQSHPFIVKTAQQEILVLGTEFNINSYADEPGTTTTLKSGSVKVSGITEQYILKPGEQSVLQNGRLTTGQANMAETLAWREGYFNFNNENIQSIMRKIARWYDVEITFEGKITSEGFNGAISRYKDINKIIELLQSTGAAHFTIEGRKITVSE